MHDQNPATRRELRDRVDASGDRSGDELEPTASIDAPSDAERPSDVDAPSDADVHFVAVLMAQVPATSLRPDFETAVMQAFVK